MQRHQPMQGHQPTKKKREGLLSMNSCLAKITVVTSMFTKLELLKKY